MREQRQSFPIHFVGLNDSWIALAGIRGLVAKANMYSCNDKFPIFHDSQRLHRTPQLSAFLTTVPDLSDPTDRPLIVATVIFNHPNESVYLATCAPSNVLQTLLPIGQVSQKYATPHLHRPPLMRGV
jgi:hypothetical protein